MLLLATLLPARGALATGDIAPSGVQLVKTENGTIFTAGMLERLAFFHLDGLDFASDFDFRAVTIGDLTQGDSRAGLSSLTDLYLKLERGPVSLFTMFEVEARVDELVADANHVNLEQVVATYDLPNEWGTINGGFGVHIVDPEGALVYGDEAPGVWYTGTRGVWSWNTGYIKRIDGNRGVVLGRSETTFPGDRSFSFSRTDVDTDILWFRVGREFEQEGGSFEISPFLVLNLRHTPQSATSVFPCPLGGGPNLANGNCDQPNNTLITDQTSSADYFYPGFAASGKYGPVHWTGEVAGRFGKIDDLPGGTFAVSDRNPAGVTSFDSQSFAMFAEAALDLTHIAPRFAGLTPFVNIQWNRGDDDPFDDQHEGWVAISDLNEIIRKDSFNLRSITSIGAMTLGGACEGTFGFNTTARGIGPTIGTSNEDASLASPVFFNNRCGKADNPGLIKLSLGWTGEIAPKWTSHFAVSPMWFHQTAPVEAEAAGSRIARGDDPLGCAGTPDCVRRTAGGIDVSPYMGTQVNMNIRYSPAEHVSFSPFLSVFVPGSGAEDINRLFLDQDDAETAVLGGIEMIAVF